MDASHDTQHPDRGRSRTNTDPQQPAALRTEMPPAPSLLSKTAQSTPMSSPGLFTPTGGRHSGMHQTSISESATPSGLGPAPLLHPLQSHRVRETHKALIDSDTLTGRKLINQYEVIEEIGRGVHGKVKLARNTETGESVAIKIIPRFSKKRRLGKLSALAPQDKTKKEIAILKKIRHPNVVALLEVIDDPELKKIYMILEHVELGEVIWRKKGLPHICSHERRRVEREMRGEKLSDEEEKYQQFLERRQRLKQLKRDRMAQHFPDTSNYWSVEFGAADEASSYGQQSRIPSRDCFDMDDSIAGSQSSSRAPSRSHSTRSIADTPAHRPHEPAHFTLDDEWDEDLETPGPIRSNPSSSAALASTSIPSRHEQQGFRGRSPSMADSIISHMSSVDFNPESHDAFADDYSYVPCFTLKQARSTFRDTVLGLEYLHYQGVVHRDIKPANMLWSKDHRVKISDFGVSYFGRPIREGEPDDTVSESEAKDFDDDLELAKTVGTPAFFAPELCYTDLEKEQPKVSEQIDVWSLGVTLYCLIYARIPFLAEDEFQMFRKIATEDVYIPKQRLKPVDPSTSPTVTSLYKRENRDPYRDDNDLEYEDVDPQLIDILRQMLTKNPEKRIRLRDIKRHPWVTQDISNVIGWLDDSDPARPTDGRKIQVDEQDVSGAVSTVTFMDRARNYVRKTINRVVHPLGDRSESHSRHRASSSVASSAGDSMAMNFPATPGNRTDRRKSLYPDDYFTTAIQDTLAHDHNRATSHGDRSRTSVHAYDPLATVLQAPEMPREYLRSGTVGDAFNNRGIPSRTMSAHRQIHSVSGIRPSHSPQLWMPPTAATTPATPVEGLSEFSRGAPTSLAQNLASASQDDSRCRSVDRGLFASNDKRAQPQVSVSTAVAPGNIQAPSLSRPGTPAKATSSRPGTPASAAQSHFVASPPSQLQTTSRPQMPADRPMTAQRVARAEDDFSESPEQYGGPCRSETLGTVQSSSTDSINGIGTPLTSPSEVTSPVSTVPGRKSCDNITNFQSDPSLPALLSGASSVSADTEGELLGKPGVVGAQPGTNLHSTTDSLTPPAYLKEPSDGFPFVYQNGPAMDSASLAMHLASSTESRGLGAERLAHGSDLDDEDDSDSGSDDGFLMMGKNKKSPISQGTSSRSSPLPLFEPRRRDTNLSIMSTETVKKLPSAERVEEE